MKIEIDVSEDNEGSANPWWAIVDPKQNMSMDVHVAADQITGPFFSRDDAQFFLETTRYNFSHRAKVYCFSGYKSNQYRRAINEAEFQKNRADKT